MSDRKIIVVDLETYDTAQTAEIRSIGCAIIGDLHGFYRRQLAHTVPFTQSEDTLAWWNKQCGAAQEEVRANTNDAKVALTDLHKWISQFDAPILVGNSAAFDLGILANAFQAYGFSVPWSYKQEACFRTMKLFYGYHIKTESLELSIPHHALWDAKLEATQLAEMLGATQWQL